jgi:hypothetical protein
MLYLRLLLGLALIAALGCFLILALLAASFRRSFAGTPKTARFVAPPLALAALHSPERPSSAPMHCRSCTPAPRPT